VVDGCVELGVKLFALPEQVAAASEREEYQSDRPEDEPSGAAYLQRRQKERSDAERAREIGADCAAAVHERLAGLAKAATTLPPQRPELHGRTAAMLLNAAYLVARDRVQEVTDAVAVLRGEWEPGGFEIELTGPWPGYNFVSSAAGIVT
jgi:hypothetical protein